MGVRILHDRHNSLAALYCSTTDVAFGPVFTDGDARDSDERAEAFIKWLRTDARRFTDAALLAKYSVWLAQESEQWKAEDEAITAL